MYFEVYPLVSVILDAGESSHLQLRDKMVNNFVRNGAFNPQDLALVFHVPQKCNARKDDIKCPQHADHTGETLIKSIISSLEPALAPVPLVRPKCIMRLALQKIPATVPNERA